MIFHDQATSAHLLPRFLSHWLLQYVSDATCLQTNHVYSETLSKNFPFDYELIDGQKLDLSSTGLREKLEKNRMNNNELSSEIFNYIKRNNIY